MHKIKTQRIHDTSIIIPTDLIAAQQLAYEPCQLVCKNIVIDAESQEYGACAFDINTTHIKFRVAKITPTKIGQFVTFWKRSKAGPIIPYDISDAFDVLVISVRTHDQFGQFVLPKKLLYEKGVLSKDGKGGKRALRVYPPWDIVNNKQAKTTQAWQINYFFGIPTNAPIDTEKIITLFL